MGPMQKKVPRVTIVHEALRRAILEQALEPGMKLPEDAVGEQFGVSRTIARRALELLAAEELIEIRPNRGASVVRPTLEEARDMFQVRVDLEDIIVRRLCGKLSRTQIGVLKTCLGREEEAHRARRPDYIRLSAEFHLKLAEMSGSPLLLRYIRQLTWRSAIVLRMHGRPEWENCNLSEHRQLIAALASGDVELCRRLMSNHLEAVLARALEGARAPADPGLRDILKRYAALPAI
jgi:DNA-binding GntR family transcriptional regulator